MVVSYVLNNNIDDVSKAIPIPSNFYGPWSWSASIEHEIF